MLNIFLATASLFATLIPPSLEGELLYLPAVDDALRKQAVMAGRPGEVVSRLRGEGKLVALTIDDGPGPLTADFEKVLAEHDVKATFFTIMGSRDSVPVTARLSAAGHSVGSHTMTHPQLPRLAASRQEREIGRSFERLSDAGVETSLFRPPYGALNASTRAAAGRLGAPIIMWDVDSRDWALRKKPSRIVANIVKGTRDGSIILIHERKQTLEVLPDIISELRSRGFTFVTLPQNAAADLF